MKVNVIKVTPTSDEDLDEYRKWRDKMNDEYNSLKNMVSACQKRLDKLEPIVNEMATWY